MVPQTKSSVTPPPHDCPLEECLSFLAGAWTPKILWYLQSKARRFGDLKRDLGSVSAKVLTTRLRELEAKGLVSRTVMPTSPPTVEYALTEFGKTFMPVLQSILEVGVELRNRTKPGVPIPANCEVYDESISATPGGVTLKSFGSDINNGGSGPGRDSGIGTDASA